MKIVGFSLLELVTALMIVSILTMLTLPLYLQHKKRVYRFEAQTALLQLGSKLELEKLKTNTYENISLTQLGFTSIIAEGRYKLTIDHLSATHFLVSASPINHSDECGKLFLDSLGEKTADEHSSIGTCWQ